MVFFSLLMMWSFSWKDYQVQPGEPYTSIWRPLWDSINFCMSSPGHPFTLHARPDDLERVGDFAVEIGAELSYFVNRFRGRRQRPSAKLDFRQAFGGADGYAAASDERLRGAYALPVSRTSYDDDIRLAPYAASDTDVNAASGEHHDYDTM